MTFTSIDIALRKQELAGVGVVGRNASTVRLGATWCLLRSLVASQLRDMYRHEADSPWFWRIRVSFSAVQLCGHSMAVSGLNSLYKRVLSEGM